MFGGKLFGLFLSKDKTILQSSIRIELKYDHHHFNNWQNRDFFKKKTLLVVLSSSVNRPMQI